MTARLADSAREILADWQPNPVDDRAQQLVLRADYIGFLDLHDDAMLRECTAGHLTASTLVLDHDFSRVLLTLHPKVNRWLQMGGHCEPQDDSLFASAAREALEESGISSISMSAEPLRLDRHTVPCRPGILLDHLDVQFLGVAPANAVESMSDESLDLRWWAVDHLPEDTDDSVRRLVSVALQRLRADAR